MKSLLLVCLLILSACLEKDLINESQGGGDYCSIYIRTNMPLSSNVNADFEEDNVPVEVVDYQGDCPQEIEVTNTYDKIIRSGSELAIQHAGYQDNYLLKDDNETELVRKRGGDEVCQIALQTLGFLNTETNALEMQSLFEFLGNCF
jgi:hypothetical protein